MSTGILNAIWQKILYGNDIIRYISPDLDSDFAVAPTLFAGAHVILSIALQFISIHFLWHGLQEKNVKKILISGATALFLTLFHPYFIPLIGLIALITTAYPNFKELKKRLKLFLLFNLFLIPSSTYYLFLMRDSAFKTHHLQINQLPLAHPIFWIITLLPFIIAIIWMKLKKTQIINQNNYWAFVWLIAATICMLLPFPWTRKYTQALLPVLIITTLPFWLHFADTLLKQSKNFLKPLLLLGCFLPFLYLFQITLTIINHPKWKYMIYHPNTMIQAWDYIQSNSPSNSLILTDSLWTNIWLPAYTNRHVWVGHPHETPEYDQKINQFQEWLLTQDNNQFNSYLNVSKINYLITQDSFSEQAETLLDNHWHKAWQIDSTIIWQNTN
ncbi:hypothetical protein KKG46_05530 [Patescibacteria group bacterium]|nr:hypothetical protein [Patescibacteria group bacterium]